MKIKSVEEKNGSLVITTDHAVRNVFVYPADKFNSYQAMIDEIKKSVSVEEDKKIKKDKKIKIIKDDFELNKDGEE